jgi:transposase
MTQASFLTPEDRQALVDLVRSALAENRTARRANAILLLDKGYSYAFVAAVLFVDESTVRGWHKLYEESGITGLINFEYNGRDYRLNEAQIEQLKAWISETLPRSAREIGEWIEKKFDIVYKSRYSLSKLLRKIGIVYRKPETISRKADPKKQKEFIDKYENMMNSASDDETIVFADAVHPTHAVRPAGCWAPKEVKVAVEQTSGRQRLNIHGAVDLESGKTCMLDVETVNAVSTIALLIAIENMFPRKRIIHVFLDNARYHHARLVNEWLAQRGRRIKLHFIPAYCPHLNPIERLWGVMHKFNTHNRSYATFAEFKQALLTFLRKEIPENWNTYCDTVSDNFRVIEPSEFKIAA